MFEKYQKKVPQPPHSVWTNPMHFIACGFGFGTFPWLPGTVGTLVAIPLVIALSHLSLIPHLLICMILLIIGTVACHITNRDFGTQDHPATVIDEITTFPIAMIGVPINWYFLLIAFVVFRFFDIIKPGPIRWIDENVHGGIGVMLDDFVAALATRVVLQLIVLIL